MTTPEIDTIAESSPNRRSFLVGGGAALAAIVFAACGNDDDDGGGDEGQGGTDTTEASAKVPAGDLDVAALAAGLEVLAVQTYDGALQAATAGKLGTVPPAVATFATTAKAQHQEHLDAWNKVLKDNGREEVSAPNAKLKPTVDGEFAKVKDVTGVAKLALQLEDIAAATYLDAQTKLESKAALGLAGSIQVVDMQHAAILNFVLGQYPVPKVFAQTEQSAAA